jgi:hypothetical protein
MFSKPISVAMSKSSAIGLFFKSVKFIGNILISTGVGGLVKKLIGGFDA